MKTYYMPMRMLPSLSVGLGGEFRVTPPLADLARGCCGVILVFDTMENALADIGDEDVRVLILKTETGGEP